MELSPQKSKALKVSLLVLGAIFLLLIGSAFGSHFGRNRNFNYYNGGCFGPGSNQFRHGDRFDGRNSGRRFRMMVPQTADYRVQIEQSDSVKNLNATSTQATSSTSNSVPVIK